ncbi:MAG: tRNA (adenosine(37)-N6)-threonylcarbamoyltransferase complex dimerization subunit type 1 TsaB [Treponema sp.]|nr:tRNA (adenosine(37)-N6)-threonylcarbamoyltransferase complex dimerization subunit type 1 TsaB [Treponema sp.]
MKLLAIDSFSTILSVALSNGEVMHFTQVDAGMRQSELVMGFIDSLCKEAGLKPKDLQGVLCMEGPGSFTGLRIGYSIAKALALSLSIPFTAIPVFDCVTRSLKDSYKNSVVLTLTDARKNAWFYAFFRDDKRLLDDGDGDYSQIINELNSFKDQGNDKIILAGPGAVTFYKAIPCDQKENYLLKNHESGFAKELIIIAREKNIFERDNIEYLFSGPEYLRKSDAELNS